MIAWLVRVSYRFGAFSKEPIAGITPIASMLDVHGDQIERRTRLAPIQATGFTHAALRDGSLAPSPAASAWRSFGQADAVPIDTPISVAGMDPKVATALQERLRTAGFATTVVGVGRQGQNRRLRKNQPDQVGRVKSAPIAPASPIAALLMQGDINIAAIGTVTMVDKGTVYAFGHPFLGWGHVNFPMHTAAIINTLATPTGSYKQGIAAREVGSITHDRLPAIAGQLGNSARLIPVRIRVQGAGPTHTTRVQVVDDQTWLPIMVGDCGGIIGRPKIGI